MMADTPDDPAGIGAVVINPEAIGRADATPEVYLGRDAMEAMGWCSECWLLHGRHKMTCLRSTPNTTISASRAQMLADIDAADDDD